MNQLVWILVAGLVAALVLQGLLLRRAHRRQLAHQQVVLQKTSYALNSKLEKTKQQIGQLQGELSSARLQVKRLGKPDAKLSAQAERALARQALERELDDATSATQRELPADGFADTQPAAPTHFGSLLMQ